MKIDQNMKNKEFYVTPETEVIYITTMEATVTSPTNGGLDDQIGNGNGGNDNNW